MTFDSIQRHAVWEEPRDPCVVISSAAWKKAMHSIKLKRTFHVHGKQLLCVLNLLMATLLTMIIITRIHPFFKIAGKKRNSL